MARQRSSKGTKDRSIRGNSSRAWASESQDGLVRNASPIADLFFSDDGCQDAHPPSDEARTPQRVVLVRIHQLVVFAVLLRRLEEGLTLWAGMSHDSHAAPLHFAFAECVSFN